MRVRRKTAILAVVVTALAAILALVVMHFIRKPRPVILQGAVIKQDADPNKQQPIAETDVTVAIGSAFYAGRSDAAGFFRIVLPRAVPAGQSLHWTFRHSGYQPLQFSEPAGNRLYVARMVPIPAQAHRAEVHRPETLVANLSVRYSIKTTTAAEIGSAAKTLEVVNVGNVPCDQKSPCSPDGRWKAAIGSGSLDAGEGNDFRNVRVSCVAGPCPFTRIQPDHISQGGRIVTVSILNWSDTATFLIEAEVFHPWVADLVRTSYPIVFGRALNFSLPAQAEGPSIEAEVGGERIFFPLGPSLCLSWADCTLAIEKEARTYRCELKPGYRF
jgi:hypothetical protein